MVEPIKMTSRFTWNAVDKKLLRTLLATAYEDAEQEDDVARP